MKIYPQKSITIEYAQTLCGDPQAITRGIIDEQTLVDAQELAAEAVKMDTFGEMGYLAAIGEPHQWWVKHSQVYKRLELELRYTGAKHFAALLRIAEHLCFTDKVDAVECRVDTLRVMRLTATEEYQVLSTWLAQNKTRF